jgi:predicted alpha/beta hydrolase family esterase
MRFAHVLQRIASFTAAATRRTMAAAHQRVAAMSIDAVPESEPCAACGAGSARLLIVPGLNDSPSGHWQSTLQASHRDAVRVLQRDWRSTNLQRWSARIGSTLARSGAGPWLAVAHSFGVLALAHHLAQQPDTPVAAVLLVAPADPDKFGLGAALPVRPLPAAATMVLSRTDPWLSLADGQRWAARWGCHVVDLGDAGHINLSSGYRSLPFAACWATQMQQSLARQARIAEAV